MRPVFYGFMESSGVLPLGAAQQQRQLGGGQSGQGQGPPSWSQTGHEK